MKKTFPERLAELMSSNNITQKALAEAVGLNDRALRWYLRGERTPSIDIAERLADYFNVSLDYLVGRSNDPAPPQQPANTEPGS